MPWVAEATHGSEATGGSKRRMAKDKWKEVARQNLSSTWQPMCRRRVTHRVHDHDTKIRWVVTSRLQPSKSHAWLGVPIAVREFVTLRLRIYVSMGIFSTPRSWVANGWVPNGLVSNTVGPQMAATKWSWVPNGLGPQ